SYEEALRASSDPREIATIKGRLAEARGQAAAAHLAQADQAAMLHDRRGVVDNLTRAYELDPSDVIKERLKAAQAEEAKACVQDGRTSLEQGKYADAVALLTRALSMGAGEDARDLLAKAKAEDNREREARYGQHVKAARAHVAAREREGP